MKFRILVSIATAAVLTTPLAACQTVSLQEYAEAANTLDPGCAKKIHAQVQPVLIFGWPVPIVSGSYDKDCKDTRAPELSDDTRAAIREEVAAALEAWTAPQQ